MMDTNRALFLQLEQMMDSKQLFLNARLRQEDITQMLDIDKEFLTKLIHEHSGCPNLQVYVNHWRVRYALRLMFKYPELTIKSISHMCGMDYLSTFNRAFREFYGQTPSEYRKKIMNLIKTDNCNGSVR